MNCLLFIGGDVHVFKNAELFPSVKFSARRRQCYFVSSLGLPVEEFVPWHRIIPTIHNFDQYPAEI